MQVKTITQVLVQMILFLIKILGRKKKPAPPPPPVLKSASSVHDIEKPSPVVASPEPQVVHRVEQVEAIKEQSDGNQGRSYFRRKIFKPLLEYRQLPKLSPVNVQKTEIEPFTLGQIYKNDVFVDTFEDSDEEQTNDDDSSCDCQLKNSISVRSLINCDQYIFDRQSTFEEKLLSHAQAYQSKTNLLPLSIMYDNRVGEFV